MAGRDRGAKWARVLPLAVLGAFAAGGCVTVNAPDKPIVIELNINIKQEVIYRLAADADKTIEREQGYFLMNRAWNIRCRSRAGRGPRSRRPHMAQRDPAYDAARSAGQVGEKMDGYLGIVGHWLGPAPADRGRDINIKRRAVYADKARAANATLEEYALTSGCLAIARTAPGEKYQAPDGSWQTRTSAPPQRDSRCPA